MRVVIFISLILLSYNCQINTVGVYCQSEYSVEYSEFVLKKDSSFVQRKYFFESDNPTELKGTYSINGDTLILSFSSTKILKQKYLINDTMTKFCQEDACYERK